MSGGADWLPWRRDWSQYPNVWKVYVAYTVLFAATAGFYLADGKIIGVFWVALAVAMVVVTRYVYRKSRPGQSDSRTSRPGESDNRRSRPEESDSRDDHPTSPL